MLIDSHVNLHAPQFAGDQAEVIARARAAGVARMVTICDRLDRFEAVHAIAMANEDVWATVGVHPHEAKDYEALDAETLIQLAARDRVVGIGETGLDYHYDLSPREMQRAVFAVHIEAARATGLPLVVHAREADEDMAQMLEDAHAAGPLTILLHCFTSGAALARRAATLGAWFSVSGIASFKAAEDVRAVIRNMPAERIIIETDCPYLAPVPFRGRRNEPAYLPHVLQALAITRGWTIGEAEQRTERAFFDLFTRIPAAMTEFASGALEITILGSGSSGGVPRADGNWGVCDPNEPKNRRSRCSLLVRRVGEGSPRGWTTVLVDTSPDLRLQTAAAGVGRIDSVVLTHDHADQTHGIDDVRAFAQIMRRRIPCWMDPVTGEQLTRRFDYIFADQDGYPAICEARALPASGEAFSIDGPTGPVPVVGYDQDHGFMPSLGFRFGPVGYSSDLVRLPESAFEILAGVDVFIVDALRDTPHPTHAHVALALEWISRIKPRRAILTNLHIDLDYQALKRRLPKGVEPAYDGLRFTVGLD